MTNFVKWLCDIRHHACQYLKVASNRMKACYLCLDNSDRFQEGDQVWLYCPTWTRGKSPTLQPSWERNYEVVIWINGVVYRTHWHPRVKMTYVDILAPWGGSTVTGAEWGAGRGIAWLVRTFHFIKILRFAPPRSFQRQMEAVGAYAGTRKFPKCGMYIIVAKKHEES
jgi:hypothetical protein